MDLSTIITLRGRDFDLRWLAGRLSLSRRLISKPHPNHKVERCGLWEVNIMQTPTETDPKMEKNDLMNLQLSMCHRITIIILKLQLSVCPSVMRVYSRSLEAIQPRLKKLLFSAKFKSDTTSHGSLTWPAMALLPD